jgi:hypothetical protein
VSSPAYNFLTWAYYEHSDVAAFDTLRLDFQMTIGQTDTYISSKTLNVGGGYMMMRERPFKADKLTAFLRYVTRIFSIETFINHLKIRMTVRRHTVNSVQADI